MDIKQSAEESLRSQPQSREAWETPQLHRLPLGDAEGSNVTSTDAETQAS